MNVRETNAAVLAMLQEMFPGIPTKTATKLQLTLEVQKLPMLEVTYVAEAAVLRPAVTHRYRASLIDDKEQGLSTAHPQPGPSA